MNEKAGKNLKKKKKNEQKTKNNKIKMAQSGLRKRAQENRKDGGDMESSQEERKQHSRALKELK